MTGNTEAGAASGGGRVPLPADPSTPNAARVYNYMLGGKDNYEVDQILAHQMLTVAPDTRTTAWFSRGFLMRAVEIAATAGVRQFVDIGAGIPISPNVHEVAQKIEPEARVVAIDYDPVVHVHTNAYLSGAPGLTAMLGDLRDPDDLIERLRADRLIDFDQPVAILIVGVLHYVMDEEDPAGIIARLRDTLAPGSYLAFTHGSVDTHADFIARSSDSTAGSSSQPRYRTPAEVTALLDGFEILEPGVVPVQDFLDEGLPRTNLVLLGGIGHLP